MEADGSPRIPFCTLLICDPVTQQPGLQPEGQATASVSTLQFLLSQHTFRQGLAWLKKGRTEERKASMDMRISLL